MKSKAKEPKTPRVKKERNPDFVTKPIEKASFASFFFGQGLIYAFAGGQYLLYFLTKHAQIDALIVSAILLVGKIWDAVNDTLFGYIIDKVRFKNGNKYKPWLWAACFLVPVFTIMMFCINPTMPIWMRITVFSVGYFLWDTAYTVCDAPAYALVTAMTPNVKERVNITTFASVGGVLATGLFSIAFVPFFNAFGGLSTALLIAPISMLAMMLLCIFSKERVRGGKTALGTLSYTQQSAVIASEQKIVGAASSIESFAEGVDVAVPDMADLMIEVASIDADAKTEDEISGKTATASVNADTTQDKATDTQSVNADTTQDKVTDTQSVNADATQDKATDTQSVNADTTQDKVTDTKSVNADTKTEDEISGKTVTAGIDADTTQDKVTDTQSVNADTKTEDEISGKTVTASVNADTKTEQESALPPTPTFKETLRYLAKNKYMLIFYIYRILSGALFIQFTVFISDYYFGNANLVSIIMIMAIPLILVVYALSGKISKKFDKITVYKFAMIASMGLSVLLFGVGRFNMYIYAAGMAIYAALNILPGIYMTAIPGDCAEYGTYKTGTHNEGITFSLQTFTAKITSAISLSLSGLLLHWIGFNEASAIQAALTLDWMWALGTLLPVVAQVIGLPILFMYKLKDKDAQLMSDCNHNIITRDECEEKLSRKY